MTAEADIRAAERAFFASLLESNRDALARVLGDDFLLVDVMSGSEVPRSAFLDLVASGQLRFDEIEQGEARVRLYGAAAVVTGSTIMRGRFGPQGFTARSRYTHVYAAQQGRWRLVSAQGTQMERAP